MGEAENRILKMLEEGRITAEEADQLLSAIGPGQSTSQVAGDTIIRDAIPSAGWEEEAGYQPPVELNKFRHRFWRIPFLVALASLVLSTLGLILMYQSAGQVAFIGFLCVWTIFVIAFIVTAFFWLIRNAPWLHVRIQEQNGHRFAISLPFPLNLADWALSIARYFVPRDRSQYLETAATFVEEMKNNPELQPIIVDVDDEDGDRVQVYIG